MTRIFTADIDREGDWFVAQCREVDVASQGETESAALANLREALALYIDDHRTTLPAKAQKSQKDRGTRA